MDATAAMEWTRMAIWQCLLIGGPVLALLLVIGVAISIVQTVTNVHDATVGFIPKLLVVAVALILGLPWIMDSLGEYSRWAFGDSPRPVAHRRGPLE